MADELNEELASDSRADWGKTKFDYYYTDYVDKDYPNELTTKEIKSAAYEQEEAIRSQKRLLSTIDDADVSDLVYDDEDESENLIEIIESRNRDLEKVEAPHNHSIKRRKVNFEDHDDEDSQEEFFEAQGDDDEGNCSGSDEEIVPTRARRPINTAIEKNRGLTPYKNKKYRNPRVKHKLKFNKVMSKRKRAVKEYKAEYNRYSGEKTGIKSSTIRSIKLC